MSNLHGFDFLRSDHTLTGPSSSSVSLGEGARELSIAPKNINRPDVANKTDLEKQFDVIHFLQSNRTSGCLTPEHIYRVIGIDLSDGGVDENVATMLKKNIKIRTEEIMNPNYDPNAELFDGEDDSEEGDRTSRFILAFGYQAKFSNIKNKAGLLAQINRCKYGVAMRDLTDAYIGVSEDLKDLMTGGDIVAVYNSDDREETLFPRGEPFLVEIEGTVMVPPPLVKDIGAHNPHGNNGGGAMTDDEVVNRALQHNKVNSGSMSLLPQQDAAGNLSQQPRSCQVVCTETDATKQIRRGEAVWVGGQWFRVSSSVKLAKQPPRALAPSSVTLQKERSKKNEMDGYKLDFSTNTLPLDKLLNPVALQNVINAKKARQRLESLGVSSNKSASGVLRKKRNISLRHHGGHHVGGSSAFGGNNAEEIKTARADPALGFSQARRHGCTTDVKEMYLATIEDIPREEMDMYKLLVSAKLIEEGEPMQRPRMKQKNLNGDGKPKKRRYYVKKGQKMTNVHLENTEIGAILAAAAERQQQGKSVGDGGM